MKEQDFIQKIKRTEFSPLSRLLRLFLKVPGVHLNWRRKPIITLA